MSALGPTPGKEMKEETAREDHHLYSQKRGQTACVGGLSGRERNHISKEHEGRRVVSRAFRVQNLLQQVLFQSSGRWSTAVSLIFLSVYFVVEPSLAGERGCRAARSIGSQRREWESGRYETVVNHMVPVKPPTPRKVFYFISALLLLYTH